MKGSVLWIVLLALLPLVATGEEKIYLEASDLEALRAKEGQAVVVHGETAGSGKTPSGKNVVRFKGSEFSLVAFKSDLKHFPDGEPAELYEAKRLAVEGTISIYQGKPQIKLTTPAQVSILDPEAVFPPRPSPPEASVAPAGGGPTTPATTPPLPAEPKRKPPVDASEYFQK